MPLPRRFLAGGGKYQACRLSSAAALHDRHTRKFPALGTGLGVGKPYYLTILLNNNYDRAGLADEFI
ncbi:MAG: hypothetical protein KA314_07180 [Chloroflexi bacterium]|nr:hypothetical protein [Chloroflexota bacterium]MBP8055608.1 hypothetical protein [Chloroflexota bacterium]